MVFFEWLADHVAAAGFSTAAPAVLASLDQHAAAVRDILALGVPSAAVAGTVLLASYARGVLDQAAELGWQPSSDADWVGLRLAAVCALARQWTTDGPARWSPHFGGSGGGF